MNYAAHYDRLIARSCGRKLEGYSERHHVLPRCMGGDESAANLVRLEPEEHYVAHQLLVKMHPGVIGLLTACIVMSKKGSGNKLYGWLRRRYSATKQSPETIARRSASLRAKNHLRRAQNGGSTLTAEQRERVAAALRGKRFSDEHRRNISAGRKGIPGGKCSDERKEKLRREKLSKRFTGIPLSEEHRKKLSDAHRGKTLPLAQRAKIAAAASGRIFTPETRAKIAASLRGRKGPKQSAETIRKRVAKLTGQRRTEEFKQRHRDWANARWARERAQAA